MKKLTFSLAFVFALLLPAQGQSFSSGSTGADGALDLTTGACQREIQLPESGILNYTTITIPTNCGVSFKRNFRNTAVIVLTTGNVNVGGAISVSGLGMTPGPGGFSGGPVNGNGFGPGGGGQGQNGTWVGSLSLVPLVGGSGAGSYGSFVGGGGGGAITIASSGSISLFSTSVLTSGGGGSAYGCGGGSGGAIRLVANSITASGSFFATTPCSGVGSGVIRLEAPAGNLVYNGSSNPLPTLSTTINPQIISDSSTPSLSISSIGGFVVSYTAGRPDIIDLMLPTQLSDPINVVVQARNIPISTQVNLNISGTSSGTFTPGTLSGTQASSSTTIAVSGLSRTGATYLIAFADFTLPGNAANLNKKGPNAIAKVRVIAKPGADSRLVFLRKNGTEIELAKIPKAIQRQFGLN